MYYINIIMRYIPTLCVDDFYTDPDAVRKFALSQNFIHSNGAWPGMRTANISEFDPKFFKEFCNKIFSIFGSPNDIKKYVIATVFQLIDKFDNDPNSPKNKGWIHYDDNCIFAGIIYLTPGADLNSGTSIFKLVDPAKLFRSSSKYDFYKNGIDSNYNELIQQHNSAFVETIRFNNVYNRLICFDSTQAHGVNSFDTLTETRLTQVFFIYELDSDIEPPIIRHSKFL